MERGFFGFNRKYNGIKNKKLKNRPVISTLAVFQQVISWPNVRKSQKSNLHARAHERRLLFVSGDLQ